ncbi:hypothetical protein [Nocardioides montaniterrae]
MALVVTVVEIARKSSGGDPLDKVDSLHHPAANVALDREQALGRAQDVATRFNTYSPDMLDASGDMPKYDALSQEMTAKFGSVFLDNSRLAAATVKQTQTRRSAHVYAAGLSSIDADSAQAIVAGTVRLAYPNPKRKGAWIEFDPVQFRYVVSMVKQHGQWLVDDIDDVDDGLPPFGESVGQQGSQGQQGGQQPSQAPSLSGTPNEGSH